MRQRVGPAVAVLWFLGASLSWAQDAGSSLAGTDAGAQVAQAPVIPDAPPLPDATPKGLERDDDMSLGWTLLRTLVVLGIVVASIYLTLNVGLRRLMGLKGPVGRGSVLEVLERVPLDAKHTLFVVRAAGEYLLLGSGEESLRLVAKLDTAAVDQLRGEKGTQPSAFLKKLLAQAPESPAEPKEGQGQT